MRLKRVVSVLAAVATCATIAATLAPTASAAGNKYVAMGDSYAVAVGTRTYDNPDDACRRGPLAYPRLWAAQHSGYSFVEASCSGATTADIISSQVPQLTADTTLVTLQVGGNDVGFVPVIENCILTIDDQDCVNGVEQAKAAANGILPSALAQTFAAVRAAAPSARVIVVGYPRLYTIHGNCGVLGLSDTERNAINSASDTLADVESAASAAAGFEYLDARPAFDPHTICSGNGEWLTSLEWDKIDESYHPNTAGHQNAYLAALDAMTG
jgi:lysophospholipase L1-like esterase